MFYYIFSTTYQSIGDLFCPFIFLDFRTVCLIVIVLSTQNNQTKVRKSQKQFFMTSIFPKKPTSFFIIPTIDSKSGSLLRKYPLITIKMCVYFSKFSKLDKHWPTYIVSSYSSLYFNGSEYLFEINYNISRQNSSFRHNFLVSYPYRINWGSDWKDSKTVLLLKLWSQNAWINTFFYF